MAGKKKLSLIIATYNRGALLERTLDSLLVQTLPTACWEAVVVNNNSTDDTESRFAAYAARHPEVDLRMVTEVQQGVSAARNRGITEAQGEYIVVIDDDETVVPTFLEDYFRLFEEQPDVSAAGGRILPEFVDQPPRWMSRYTERAIAGTLDLGEVQKEFPQGTFFGGGNHGFRRVLIERYGGFDPALGRTGAVLLAGEEKDFFLRLRAGGERIVYLPQAVIHHLIDERRMTRDYFTRLCRNLGRSERRRTKAVSGSCYAVRLVKEVVKWGGAAVIGAGYLCAGHPAKGGYLLLMRWHITLGLLGA